MEGEAVQGTTSGAQVPTGRGRAAPGSRSYLTLAEIGYLAQAVLVMANVVVLAVTLDIGYAMSLPATAIGVIVSLVLSVAWFQLGRSERNSWFQAAGVFGVLGAVLSSAQLLESGQNPLELYITIVVPIVSLVSLIYFAMQLLALYSAASVFQVRLFRWAAYAFAIGFVVTSVGGSVALVVTATDQVGSQHGLISSAVFGLGFLFSVATSLIAAIGFHRLRGPSGRMAGVSAPTPP